MIEMNKIQSALLGATVDLSYHAVRIRMAITEIMGLVNMAKLEKNELLKPHRGNILGILPTQDGKKKLVIDCRRDTHNSESNEIAVHAKLRACDTMRIEAVLVYDDVFFDN